MVVPLTSQLRLGGAPGNVLVAKHDTGLPMITRNFHMREGPDPGARPTRPEPEPNPEGAEGPLRRGLRWLLRRLGRARAEREGEGRGGM